MAKAQVSEVFNEVKDALNDPNAVRWTNAKLYRYLLEAERMIASNHPETQYDGKVENVAPALLTATTDYTTIHSDHAPALVHYMCFRAFTEDSDSAGNQKLSQYHFQLYKNALEDVSVGR